MPVNIVFGFSIRNSKAIRKWSPRRQEPVAPSKNATSRNFPAFLPRQEPGDSMSQGLIT